MPRNREWPFARLTRVFRYFGFKDYKLKGVIIGDAGNPDLGESIPVVIGEYLRLNKRVSEAFEDVHQDYYVWLAKRRYKGAKYVIAQSYQVPESYPEKSRYNHTLRPTPDGRTRKVIRDLKRYKSIRGE